MNKVTYLDGKEDGVKALAQAAYPAYGGRIFKFEARDSVALSGSYWDGGSRSSYVGINLETRKSVAVPQFDPPQFGGPIETPKVVLRPNFAIVEHSFFCGKDMGLTFYIHPSDAPQMITESDSVTDDEKIVLEFTAALKNTYGGRTNIRLGEARRKYGITRERWEDAQGPLKPRKLLNKAGSITPQGRNVDTSPYRS